MIKGICVLVFAIFVLGCSSVPKGYAGKENIHGLIVDSNNSPVSGYCITIGENKYYSNETGLFTIDKIFAGSYHMIGTGHGYLEIEKDIVINNKKEILYVRVYSLDEVLNEVENCFNAKDWEKAEDVIAHAAESVLYGENTDRKDIVLFYKAIILYYQEKYEEAMVALNSMQKENEFTNKFKNFLIGRLK
jgi:hypothetical protein